MQKGRLRWWAAIWMACACAGGSHSPVDENPSGGTQHDPTYDLDALGVPQFVNTNYIDLARLTRISLFRSHDGHDYSDGTETCRSMKHYFKVPTSSTVVYAPVSGVVRTIYEEWAGTQVQIRSNAQPAFTFIIFHISLASPLSVGATVTEGSILGTHIGIQTWSDIAVEVNTPSGRRLVSYFETLTESAFAPFLARGSRAQPRSSSRGRSGMPIR